MAASSAYKAEVENWRQEAEAKLKAPDGWLAVAGLFWLDEGRTTFGSAADNKIVLPAPAPAHAGVFDMKNRKVTVTAGASLTIKGKSATTMALRNDADGKQDRAKQRKSQAFGSFRPARRRGEIRHDH